MDDSLQSILAIDKPEQWEILIGDDGSTDGTITKVQEYLDKYPDHIRFFTIRPEEKGDFFTFHYAVMNRLRLLEQATGDYFCILDGDDWYIDKSFVTEAIEVMEKNSTISVVMHKFKLMKDGVCIGDGGLPRQGLIDSVEYIKGVWYSHSGAGVYRHCFGKDRIDYLRKYRLFDDAEIVSNALNYGNIYSVDKEVYAYRQLTDSIWNGQSTFINQLYGLVWCIPDVLVLPDNLKPVMKNSRINRIIDAYLNREKLNVLSDEDKAKLDKMIQPYLPTPIYDLLHYDELDRKQFWHMKRQLLKGYRLCYAKIRLCNCMVSLYNRLPCARKLWQKAKKYKVPIE